MIIIQIFYFIILLYLFKYYPAIFWGIIELKIRLVVIMLIMPIIMRSMLRMEVNIVELFFQNQLIRYIYLVFNFLNTLCLFISFSFGVVLI